MTQVPYLNIEHSLPNHIEYLCHLEALLQLNTEIAPFERNCVGVLLYDQVLVLLQLYPSYAQLQRWHLVFLHHE